MKVVHQRDLKDCGVASLQSIIKNYNGFVSLEMLRIDTKTNNNGTTALNLIEASKKYGFDAVGMKLEYDALSNIKLPAIAHLKLDNGYMHFVVIYKVTKNKIVLMDPAKGKVIKTKEEFCKYWSNIVLVFYPKRRISVLKKNNSLIKIFIKIIKNEKKLVLTILLYSVLFTIFAILSSYYFKVMLDAISLNYHKVYLFVIVFIFFIITIYKIIFYFMKKYLENHLNKNIDCYLNDNFISHIFKLPLNVITSRTSGEIITRVNELDSIKSLFTEVFINYIINFLMLIMLIPILLNINRILFFILFVSIIIYLIIGIISSKIIYKKAYINIEYASDFNNSLLENLNMIDSIKNLNLSSNSLREIENVHCKYINDSYKFSKFLNFQNLLKNIINDITLFIINTVGFWLVFSHTINITELITFNSLMSLFIDPIKNTIDLLPKYNFLKATFVKIDDFLGVKKEELGNFNSISDNSITINKLCYSYNHLDIIINNISFFIPSNSFVLLNGKSGSGKSTICKILTKYIDNYRGDILIGNVNLKDISINTIRSNITYVNQTECIKTGTIKDNILLNRNIDNNYFNDVCKICEIEDIVSKKPLRYQTTINNYSNNISGGEMQRIILARALLKEFKILILDEALSEVDLKLERKIIQNIRNYYKDKTIIYITHKKHRGIYNKEINIGETNELQ